MRGAVNVESDGCYLSDPSANFTRVTDVTDQAIERGIYVIVDWQDHAAQNHTAEATDFFARIARQYANVPTFFTGCTTSRIRRRHGARSRHTRGR